ncbi:MAG TPA: hypothetical protein VK302_16570 [Terriglobales bacterium]|nr:hypothetical protein [Terriglobales bacterium]
MAKNGRFGWLLGAAGLTGVLIALGYVVRAAQSDLLGVSTYDPERAGYLLAAGDLILNTLLSLLDWPALVALIVGVVLVGAIELGRSRSPRFRAARSLLGLGVGSLCAVHLLFFTLPTAPISDLLIPSESVCLGRQFDVSRVYRWRTDEVWKQVLCSKVSDATLPECSNRAPQEYRRDLELTFTTAVLAASLLWVAGWRILYFEPPQSEIGPKWWGVIPWEWSRTLLMIGLLLVLFGLAYQYGKTVKSTIALVAEVDFEEGAASKTSGASPEEQQTRSFLVVADSGTSTILYDVDIHKERVWIVRDTAIRIERVSSLEDVLKRRIGIHRSSCTQEVPVQ